MNCKWRACPPVAREPLNKILMTLFLSNMMLKLWNRCFCYSTSFPTGSRGGSKVAENKINWRINWRGFSTNFSFFPFQLSSYGWGGGLGTLGGGDKVQVYQTNFWFSWKFNSGISKQDFFPYHTLQTKGSSKMPETNGQCTKNKDLILFQMKFWTLSFFLRSDPCPYLIELRIRSQIQHVKRWQTKTSNVFFICRPHNRSETRSIWYSKQARCIHWLSQTFFAILNELFNFVLFAFLSVR